MTCSPAARIAAFARVLLPISAVTCGGGPMNVTPCCAHSVASSGFSDRKPQPGMQRGAARLHGGLHDALDVEVADCAARAGPSTTTSRPRVYGASRSASLTANTGVMPSASHARATRTATSPRFAIRMR